MGIAPEKLYKEALEKLEVIEVIRQPSEIAETYREAAADMKAVGDYKDAKVLAEKYLKLAQQAEEKGREQLYQRAVERMDQAQTVVERKLAIDTFQRVKGYKDADERIRQCRQINEAMTKRKTIGGWSILIIALAAGIGLIVFLMSPMWRYHEAEQLFEKNSFTEAKAIYRKLDGYKDSEEKIVLCDTKAEELERQNEMEKILNAKRKDTVIYGPYTWIVLEENDKELMLLNTHSDFHEEFVGISYHNKKEAVTWETCELRKWLNGEFLEKFSEEELDRMLVTEVKNTENPVYGTDAGGDTEDRVYLLSIEEAQEHMDIIETMSLSWLLRTPGSTQKSVTYITPDHIIADYGCPVEWDQYDIRPVIRISKE
ncbi:MAG: DUF6273 domain-containing protein [Marvinbryantia sp.]|jgi:tetratricopeptide (TPR) repeat protein